MKDLDRESGITLVEVVVALLVLGFVLTAYAGVLMSNLKSISDSRARQDASQAATEVIERLRDESPAAVAMKWDFDPATVSCGDPAVEGDVDVFGDGTLCEPLALDPDAASSGIIDGTAPWAGTLGAVDYRVYATEVSGTPAGRVRVTVVADYELSSGPKEIRRNTIFSEASRG